MFVDRCWEQYPALQWVPGFSFILKKYIYIYWCFIDQFENFDENIAF